MWHGKKLNASMWVLAIGSPLAKMKITSLNNHIIGKEIIQPNLLISKLRKNESPKGNVIYLHQRNFLEGLRRNPRSVFQHCTLSAEHGYPSRVNEKWYEKR